MEHVTVQVSGAAKPLTVQLERTAGDSFRAGVQMPPALQITDEDFRFEEIHGKLPLVRMEGISHIIVRESTPFFRLKDSRADAEQAVRSFCHVLGADGLGLMFLEDRGGSFVLTPLVYIPGSGTCFWENSCASGSTAAGMYLAHEAGRNLSCSFREPGGQLQVESSPDGRDAVLWGSVRLTGRFRQML